MEVVLRALLVFAFAWVVIRVSDPAQANPSPGPDGDGRYRLATEWGAVVAVQAASGRVVRGQCAGGGPTGHAVPVASHPAVRRPGHRP